MAVIVVMVGVMVTIIPYIIALGLFLLVIYTIGAWIQSLQDKRNLRGPR